MVRIVTPLKRDAIRARPVVAMEDVAASKRLEDLARSYGLEVEQEHVPLTGEIDLNRPGLIVVCGPRLSDVMRQLYEQDPVLAWKQTPAGAWAICDKTTSKLYISGSDSEEPEARDAAYLGRLRRPDGRGWIIAFTGIHPQGTLGVVHLLTTEIGMLWEEVQEAEFSVVVGVQYDSDSHEPVSVELLTPLYRHNEV
jgi:hypothetical protein